MFRKYNFEQSPEMKSLKASPVFRIEAALPKIHTSGLHGYCYDFSHEIEVATKRQVYGRNLVAVIFELVF